jgi:uncharacterized protein
MQIIRVADQRAMPWKNGGGVTYQVAIAPPDAASLEDFDWRVSMARVETDGPFSHFAGIDRSLAIMEGDGLRLIVGGVGMELGPQSPALAFAGDVPVSATLIGGPIIDLGVMTRRGAWRHRLVREDVTGTRTMVADADATLVVIRSGIVRMGGDPLQPRDAVRLTAGERLIAIADTPAQLFRIELTRE